MEAPVSRTEEWQPGRTLAILWNLLGVALCLTGVASFAAIYALAHRGRAGGELGIAAVLVTLALFVVLLGLHE